MVRISQKPKDLSQDIVRVIGLVWSGYVNIAQIALITGQCVHDVEKTLESQDVRIRHALMRGLRADTAKLEFPVVCRECRTLISVVPCVTCRCNRYRKETAGGQH